MSRFSPADIYERGRQRTLAEQPQYYAKFRKLLDAGLALSVPSSSGSYWMALAPWSRLEPRLLLAYDLAEEGEGGLRRIEFATLDFTPETDETWGWILDAGEDVVASFRPLFEAEDELLIGLWNIRSGRTPIQYVAP